MFARLRSFYQQLPAPRQPLPETIFFDAVEHVKSGYAAKSWRRLVVILGILMAIYGLISVVLQPTFVMSIGSITGSFIGVSIVFFVVTFMFLFAYRGPRVLLIDQMGKSHVKRAMEYLKDCSQETLRLCVDQSNDERGTVQVNLSFPGVFCAVIVGGIAIADKISWTASSFVFVGVFVLVVMISYLLHIEHISACNIVSQASRALMARNEENQRHMREKLRDYSLLKQMLLPTVSSRLIAPTPNTISSGSNISKLND